jgi:hypothetical protein
VFALVMGAQAATVVAVVAADQPDAAPTAVQPATVMCTTQPLPPPVVVTAEPTAVPVNVFWCLPQVEAEWYLRLGVDGGPPPR